MVFNHLTLFVSKIDHSVIFTKRILEWRHWFTSGSNNMHQVRRWIKYGCDVTSLEASAHLVGLDLVLLAAALAGLGGWNTTGQHNFDSLHRLHKDRFHHQYCLQELLVIELYSAGHMAAAGYLQSGHCNDHHEVLHHLDDSSPPGKK